MEEFWFLGKIAVFAGKEEGGKDAVWPFIQH
jgi:hypothetical protein